MTVFGPRRRSAAGLAADPVLTSTFADRFDPAGFGFAFNFNPALASNAGGAMGAANRALYSRVVNGCRAVTKIRVGVAIQSGNVCVATFPASGVGVLATPGARSATSGSVACPAAGVADITLSGPIDLEPGDFIGLATDNNTVRFYSLVGPTAAGVAVMAGVSYYQETAFPLPSTPAPVAAAAIGPILLIGIP